MKNYIVFLLVPLILCSCGAKDDPHEKPVFKFYPKKVTTVITNVAKRHEQHINGYVNVSYESTSVNDVVKEDSAVLVIGTFNVKKEILRDPNITFDQYQYYYFEYLDPSLPSVEKQIGDSYTGANSTIKSASGDFAYLVRIFYRTTEVRNLTISALNTSLFGVRAGESLNDFFDIETYDPPVIFNAPSQTLLYGYSSKSRPVSIGEWLSLSPLASVEMDLVPNTKIDNLPVSVQFVVKMETADGLVLRDTTRMVTITR
ncbi:MAG: hypothetical protein BGN96_08100 [Bacteroidales bacterium 45-6]|nr:MAG: hypothetical protein BGN96_08100 [Bacteroidales bacterium 45-6]